MTRCRSAFEAEALAFGLSIPQQRDDVQYRADLTVLCLGERDIVTSCADRRQGDN